MPTASQTLREKRARIIEQMREAAKKSQELRNAGQSTTDPDLVFDRAEAEERELHRAIEREERLEALERQAAERHLEEHDKDAGAQIQSEYRDVFRRWFMYGPQILSQEERTLLNSRRPSVPEFRAQSTSNTAGGYLIAPEYMDEIERSIKDFSGVMQVARIETTATGAAMPWPTHDGTARKAVIVSENTQSTATDFTFGTKTLNAFTYRDMAAASLELLQDNAFNLSGFINDEMSESFGRALNEHFTIGNGTSQPNGLAGASTLGKTAASATAITRAEIVDLIHQVDPGYRKSKSCGFMLHDNIIAAIKKLQLGSGDASPLWQPSMREGTPDKIEGFPFWINQDMDSTLVAAKKVILFGDFRKYVIRRVMGMTFFRLEERFIDFGQIGFIAFARYDGELMNTSAVKHLITAAS